MIDNNNITRTVLRAFDKFLQVRGGCTHPCETQLHCLVTAVMSCYCYHEVGTKPQAACPSPPPFSLSFPFPSSVGRPQGDTVTYKYAQLITVRFQWSLAVCPLPPKAPVQFRQSPPRDFVFVHDNDGMAREVSLKTQKSSMDLILIRRTFSPSRNDREMHFNGFRRGFSDLQS